MLITAIVVGLASLGLWMAFRNAELRPVKFAYVPPAIIAILCFIGSSVTVVPAGHVGVPVVFGSVSNSVLYEGLHVINPLADVQKLSVRTETYTMNAGSEDALSVISADGVSMPVDVSIAFRLVPEAAPAVYRNLGPHYLESILRPAARTAIREVAAKYPLQEAYSTRREEMAERMRFAIAVRIRNVAGPQIPGGGVEVQEVFLRRIELPQNLKAAIEQKMSADQEAQRMAYVLQREQQEAERKRIEARGIRDFQAIVSEGISDKLLQWKGIEATETLSKSNNSKVVVIGGGRNGLPLILNAAQ